MSDRVLRSSVRPASAGNTRDLSARITSARPPGSKIPRHLNIPSSAHPSLEDENILDFCDSPVPGLLLKDYYLKKESSSKPMEARTTQLIKGPSHKVKASKAKNSSSSSPARKSPSIISNEEE
eukprot:gene38200-50101_t